nr:hypothetical protein GCM10020093_032220 [Planobispora longispora]
MWYAGAVVATGRIMLHFQRGSMADAGALIDSVAGIHATMDRDSRILHLCAQGRTAQARGLAEHGWGTPPRDWSWLTMTCLQAAAQTALGDVSACRASYSALLPHGGGVSVGSAIAFAGPVDWFLALLASALGERETAVRHLVTLARLAGRNGLVRWRDRARSELGLITEGDGARRRGARADSGTPGRPGIPCPPRETSRETLQVLSKRADAPFSGKTRARVRRLSPESPLTGTPLHERRKENENSSSGRGGAGGRRPGLRRRGRSRDGRFRAVRRKLVVRRPVHDQRRLQQRRRQSPLQHQRPGLPVQARRFLLRPLPLPRIAGPATANSRPRHREWHALTPAPDPAAGVSRVRVFGPEDGTGRRYDPVLAVP